jgi:transposase-like protein
VKEGRPTKYKEEFVDQVYKLCLLGHTDKELAVFFDISESTLYKWKQDYLEFSEALKNGKEIADGNIAASFYQRAKGYEHPEEKVFNNQGEILTHQTTKHYPPDSSACLSWLKNRQPDKWRDKVEVDNKLSGELTVNEEVDLSKLDKATLLNILNAVPTK